MKKKLKLAGGTALLAAAIGGGAALAADRMSPAEESDAVVADVAKQLGVPEAKVEAALEEALANRVDAAVEAGRLTEAQGEELKERLRSGDFPLVGLGPGRGLHGGGHHLLGGLDAAADYLGLTDALCRRLNRGADAFLFGSADRVCGIPRLPAGDGAYSSLLLASSKRFGAHHGESYLREKSR